MKMKRFLMRAALLAACTVGPLAISAHAQGMGGGMGQMSPEERQARQLEALKPLNLTDDQVTKIKAIWTERDKKMMELRESGGDMETMRPKMMELMKDTNDKIKAILTDEQKPKFDEIQAKMRGGRPGPPPQ